MLRVLLSDEAVTAIMRAIREEAVE